MAIYDWNNFPEPCTAGFSANFYGAAQQWQGNLVNMDNEIEAGRGGLASLDARFDAAEAFISIVWSGSDFIAGSIPTSALDYVGTPLDGYALIWRSASAKFVAEDISGVVGADTYQVKLTGSGDAPGYLADVWGVGANHAANTSLAVVDCRAGKIHTNAGATGPVTLTLPVGEAWYDLSFLVVAAYPFIVQCHTGDRIYYGSQSTSDGGTVQSDVVGTSWRLTCRASGIWQITSLQGYLEDN